MTLQTQPYWDARHIQTPLLRERPNPLLWLAREMIWAAFRDAVRLDSCGAPTVEACLAVEWLAADLDWTRRNGPIPPQNIREEYVLSFSWCCGWLGLDPAAVRERGLPADAASMDGAGGDLRIRARKSRGHTSRKHVRGLPHVYEVWARAAKEYEDKIDSDQSIESVAVSTAVEACLASV